MSDVVVVTNTGFAKITDLLASVTTVTPHWIGWGEGGYYATPTHEDTSLGYETEEPRTVGTVTQTTTTHTNDTYKVTGQITAINSTKTIDEVGLFSHLTTGNLSLHAAFNTIIAYAGDTITFDIRIKFGP